MVSRKERRNAYTAYTARPLGARVGFFEQVKNKRKRNDEEEEDKGGKHGQKPRG